MRHESRILLAAVLAIGSGAAFYVLTRDWSSVYLLAWAADWQSQAPRLRSGAWAGSFPSFAHALGFSLLTALALGGGARRTALACAFWGVTDGLLELLQQPAWAAAIPPLPVFMQDWPLVENAAAYFRQGRFDVMDLAAIAAGVLAAWLITYGARSAVGLRPKLRRYSHANYSL